MNNLEYLKNNIEEVEDMLLDMRKRIAGGEQYLEPQYESFERHLRDLEKQVAEKEKEQNRYRVRHEVIA